MSQEVLEIIVLKELKACRYDLHQNVENLRDLTVNLYQDNQTVYGALLKLSSKCPALMTEIKDLVPWFHENKNVYGAMILTGKDNHIVGNADYNVSLVVTRRNRVNPLEKRCEDLKLLRCLIRPSLRNAVICISNRLTRIGSV